MSEWKTYKLGDVADILTGFPFKGKDYDLENGIRVLRGENVSLGYLRWDSQKHWNLEFDQIEKYSLNESDIVVGMDGSRVGKNKAQVKEKDLPMLLAQRVARIRANEGFSQDFISHSIKSYAFERYVKNVHTGTSIPHISAKQIKNYEFKAPSSFEVQRQIAAILSSLDDKIELNLQMNQTLEKMAQAIFKEWFVDFNFPGFDGELVDGLPKGWRKTTIGEIGRVITGSTPSSKKPEYFGSKVSFITPTDFKHYGKLITSSQRYLSDAGKVKMLSRLLPVNSVIVTCIGSDMGKIAINRVECVTNQQINSIIPNNELASTDYLYYYLNHISDYLKRIARGGSTMPIINKSKFEAIEIILPKIKVIKSFQEIIDSTNEKIEANILENKSLSQTRDTLLPKLMSGEISLNYD